MRPFSFLSNDLRDFNDFNVLKDLKDLRVLNDFKYLIQHTRYVFHTTYGLT